MSKVCTKSTFNTFIISPLCTVWTSGCCVLLAFSSVVWINNVAFVATSALSWIWTEESAKWINCLTFSSWRILKISERALDALIILKNLTIRIGYYYLGLSASILNEINFIARVALLAPSSCLINFFAKRIR